MDPELQGNLLLDGLKGYNSLRATAQRYRIIYRIYQMQVEVFVVAIGRRAECPHEKIHRLAQRLLRLPPRIASVCWIRGDSSARMIHPRGHGDHGD